jgi:hypothetical protein
MAILDTLIPRQANNDYRGGAVPLYSFGLLSVVMTVRSLIHYLKEDSGVNSIATIMTFSGTPDPNNVIYMFSSLWGTQQLLFCVIYVIVLIRYRNLVPLMWALFIAESLLRISVGLVLHPLTPEYFESTPPGAIANLPMLVLACVMLALALRAGREPQHRTVATAAADG